MAICTKLVEISLYLGIIHMIVFAALAAIILLFPLAPRRAERRSAFRRFFEHKRPHSRLSVAGIRCGTCLMAEGAALCRPTFRSPKTQRVAIMIITKLPNS